VTVCDDGRGMSEAVAARAFEPFFTTRRGAGGSTGLGLHIVHNLVVQVLGGSIRLQRAASGGCEFELLLPLRAPERG
jgi:two-component system, NtrC family, sensor kinase